MSGVRRSGRAQAPSKKYSDRLNEINDILGSDSDINVGTGSENGDDEEFDELDAEAAAQEENDIQDDASDVEEAVRSSADEGAVDVDADYDNDLVEFETPTLPPRKKQKRDLLTVEEIGSLPAFDPRATKPSRYERTHTRGVIELVHRDSRHRQILTSFGPGTEDLAAYIRTKNKWYDQLCLPTEVPNTKTGAGGLAYSFFYPEAKRDKERTAGWEWYYERGGRDAFKQYQKSVDLPVKESHSFRPTTNSNCDLIYGSMKQPKHRTLPPGKTIDLRSAFNATDRGHKDGFILNVGAKVTCLEWVPNQLGSIQYLCTTAQRSSYQDEAQFIKEADKIHGPKAYTPSPRFRGCMEIWEVNPDADKSDKKSLCRAVFSWDWGDLKCMQWCPAPTRHSPESDDNRIELGLLAGVWSDGYIRVLNLSINKDQILTQYTHVAHAAFESKPPDTICIGLCWLSSQTLAASCANGFISIWDLSHVLSQRSKAATSPSYSTNSAGNTNPRPWFYHQLHQSYIYTITSGYPSRPHMLFTNSIDGYIRLTDLRSPIIDTTTSFRSRVQLPSMSWSDHCQSVLSTDENLVLKLNPLRRFYSSTSFGRCEGLVTSFAVSDIHPFVLAGCADGKVWATNPLRRSGGRSRHADGKGGNAMVCWFEHTWRRGVDSKSGSNPENGEEEGDPVDVESETPRTAQEKRREEMLRKPLVRFVDGFKVVRPSVGGASSNAEGKAKKAPPGGNIITVHEEQTAVTKVAWNSNLGFGTWAAAAMASGLVRIENLAVDLD